MCMRWCCTITYIYITLNINIVVRIGTANLIENTKIKYWMLIFIAFLDWIHNWWWLTKDWKISCDAAAWIGGLQKMVVELTRFDDVLESCQERLTQFEIYSLENYSSLWQVDGNFLNEMCKQNLWKFNASSEAASRWVCEKIVAQVQKKS